QLAPMADTAGRRAVCHLPRPALTPAARLAEYVMLLRQRDRSQRPPVRQNIIMDHFKLTPKQAQFVQEYLIDLNATQATIRTGHSPKRADEQGYENLRKPEIQTALAAERLRLAATLQITPERVLQEYARLAFADLRRVASWDSAGVHFHDSAALADQDAAAIAEVHEDTRMVSTEQGEVKTVKKRLKMHDKKGALDSLAKHLKLFHDEAPPPPDIHVHLHSARERLSERLAHLAQRHAEDATNGH